MHFSIKGWESVLFELGSERVKLKSGSPAFLCSTGYVQLSPEVRSRLESALSTGERLDHELVGHLADQTSSRSAQTSPHRPANTLEVSEPPLRGTPGSLVCCFVLAHGHGR